MSRDDAAILDALRACRLTVNFCAGMDEAAFLNDLKTQSAVLHQLLLLGEGVKRLSEGFRQSHAEVPWRVIARMRDKPIHEYDEVDLQEVWKTTERDIPELIGLLEPLAKPKT